MRAAANGAVTPKRTMLIDIAAPIVACDQPNSMCNGSIITLGTARNPAAPMIAMNEAAATSHAQCTRRRPVRDVVMMTSMMVAHLGDQWHNRQHA